MKAKAVVVKCAFCGIEFKRFPSGLKVRNFCSPACNVAWRKLTGFHRRENNVNWNGGVECTCEECGKKFTVKRSQRARGNGRHCSLACKHKANNVECKCETCGTSFSIKKSHYENGRGRYCSLECRSIGYVARGVFAGERNPNFANKNCYSPEYIRRKGHKRRALELNCTGIYTAEEWVALCEQHGNKCLACGRDDVQLTVDHIVPLSKGGSNSIDNIQPLCLSCNSRKSNKTINYRPDVKREGNAA